jgi:pyruvate/2-oxoglutarate dehydrogenase complex dihydrolipoamide dehydrogenase (E3) component
MSDGHRYDVLVLGRGTDGKQAAWTMAQESKRTTVVERKYISGSSTNIGCLPSKNVIHTTRVASLVGRHQEFGL